MTAFSGEQRGLPTSRLLSRSALPWCKGLDFLGLQAIPAMVINGNFSFQTFFSGTRPAVQGTMGSVGLFCLLCQVCSRRGAG